jgi:hypothetical protein
MQEDNNMCFEGSKGPSTPPEQRTKAPVQQAAASPEKQHQSTAARHTPKPKKTATMLTEGAM